MAGRENVGVGGGGPLEEVVVLAIGGLVGEAEGEGVEENVERSSWAN